MAKEEKGPTRKFEKDVGKGKKVKWATKTTIKEGATPPKKRANDDYAQAQRA
jgi:hypothetical protein